MKKLVVSIKSSSDALAGFKKAYMRAKSGKLKEPHYEISFDNRKSFEKIAKNIHVLSCILIFKPQSVYELAKISGIDVSNLNKLIIFFEELGAVTIKRRTVNGREVKMPVIDYDEIKIDLNAA